MFPWTEEGSEEKLGNGYVGPETDLISLLFSSLLSPLNPL